MGKSWRTCRPRKVFFIIGFFFIGKCLFHRLYPAVTQNTREPVDMKKRYGAGTWVVVTGAANELGKEYVKLFNSQGFNVVMID